MGWVWEVEVLKCTIPNSLLKVVWVWVGGLGMGFTIVFLLFCCRTCFVFVVVGVVGLGFWNGSGKLAWRISV